MPTSNCLSRTLNLAFICSSKNSSTRSRTAGNRLGNASYRLRCLKAARTCSAQIFRFGATSTTKVSSLKDISSISKTRQSITANNATRVMMAEATEDRCALCTSITAQTIRGAMQEIAEAEEAGADIVELRIDYLANFLPDRDLVQLLEACQVPAIVTFRPDWEGGEYSGDEGPRLAALAMAAQLGAPYVDIELKAAENFFSIPGLKSGASKTKFIVSSHNYEETLPSEELDSLAGAAWAAGADIFKVANVANDISDVARMVKLIQAQSETGPVIGLEMSERGQMSRILAPKFGSMLTFGALTKGKESAPGQPALQDLVGMYRLKEQSAGTPVYGVIGNPVSHSRSPVLHNSALAASGLDGCYLPLLVDDLQGFLDAFDFVEDFKGFSVTIPHKEAALKACSEVDPVAEAIGAVNTLVRKPDGTWKGYNTDWLAAVDAIEVGLGGPGSLKGRKVVVLGAGGAGRALAFGAKEKGASEVLIANRNYDRAVALAEVVGCTAVRLEEVREGQVGGDVLVNTTAVGMHPNEDESPMNAEALKGYALAFDAIYTPMQTLLLKQAEAAGAVTVSGLEMFVGQAAAQFELFTGKKAPVDLMRQTVLDSLN